MLLDWVYTGLGLTILLLAGDVLVRGAVNLSLRLGLPALIVSLTIVAFGTSAPELLIAIKAVLDDAPGIAMGNVVGSNIANILLVLGIPALIAGLETKDCDSRRSYLFMIAASVLFIAIAAFGTISFTSGLILLAALSVILVDQAREAHAHRTNTLHATEQVEEVEGVDPDLPWWKISLYLVLGLIGLPLGADLLVDGAVNIATIFGVSDTIIGLTLVAVGTSLPELATTVMAALRRQADVAIGNVIGSNMFNLLAIIGITALVGDIPVADNFLRFDLWVMLGVSLMMGPFVFLKWNMGKTWGIVLTAMYAIYVVMLLNM